MAKLDLNSLTARAAQRLGGKPAPKYQEQAKASDELAKDLAEIARPLADLLGNAMPEPTELEAELDQAIKARIAKPRLRGGPDPRLPWVGKGTMDSPVPAKAIPVQEKIALDNAIARAKAGRSLTLKERKLLGKHQLARIMARFRPKGGDCG